MTAWSTRYIGIPFVDNGRSFNGCDCGGLAWLVYKTEMGKELKCFDREYSAMGALSRSRIIRSAVDRFFTPLETPQAMALAVFGTVLCDYHVGVFVDSERILHCKEGEHAKIQYLDQLAYAGDFRGAYAVA